MTECVGCSLLCLFWQKIESLNVSTQLSAYQNRIFSNDFLRTNDCKRNRHSTSYSVTFERLSPLLGTFKISSWQLESIINMQRFEKPTASVGVENKMLPVSDIWKRFLLLLPASIQSKILYLSHREKAEVRWRAQKNTKSQKVVPSHMKITEEYSSCEGAKGKWKPWGPTALLHTYCKKYGVASKNGRKFRGRIFISFQKMYFLLYLKHFSCAPLRQTEMETNLS